MMRYKGYIGRARRDTVSDTWEGEVVGLPAVKYRSKQKEQLEPAFQSAVDHYLTMRQEGASNRESLVDSLRSKTQTLSPDRKGD